MRSEIHFRRKCHFVRRIIFERAVYSIFLLVFALVMRDLFVTGKFEYFHAIDGNEKFVSVRAAWERRVFEMRARMKFFMALEIPQVDGGGRKSHGLRASKSRRLQHTK